MGSHRMSSTCVLMALQIHTRQPCSNAALGLLYGLAMAHLPSKETFETGETR